MDAWGELVDIGSWKGWWRWIGSELAGPVGLLVYFRAKGKGHSED